MRGTISITAAIVMGMAALTLVVIAFAHHTQDPVGNCDRIQADAKWDCVINSQDQLVVGAHVGTRVDTYTPLATSTPTNTPTVTPTPTNTPQITIAEIVDDTTGAHEGVLCTGAAPTGVSGYDWQFNGRINDATSDETEFTAWGTMQWQDCGVYAADTITYWQNLKVYAKIASGWHFYPAQDNPFNWCWELHIDTTTSAPGHGACPVSNGGYLMPAGSFSQHWAEATDTLVADDICHLVLVQAKKSGPGAVMANLGFDWRVGTASAGDSWFGQYNLLTTDWKWIGGSSCTATQLAGAPLP